MGAWSGEPFGNDTAADWAWELDDANDWDLVRAALDEVLAAGDEVDSDTATIAIAAADVVGRALARSTVDNQELAPIANDDVHDEDDDNDFDDEDEDPDDEGSDDESVAAFLARVGEPPSDIVQLALAGLAAASGPMSELTELWIESGDDDWNVANARVRSALGG